MKSFTFLLPIIFAAASAHADMMKPATVNLVCTGPADSRVIKIVSDDKGAVVFVNNKKVHQQDQLIAGTEGGSAYMQAVGGGYNVTISGGDFNKAFNTSTTIKNGQAPASVWDSSTNKSVNFVCKGTYSFN